MLGTLRASGLRFGTHFCTDAGISWIFVCVKNKTLAPICDVAVTAVSSSIARLMQCSPTSRAAHGDDDARTPSSVSAFPVTGVSVLKTAFKMSVIIYLMTFTTQLCYRGVKTITKFTSSSSTSTSSSSSSNGGCQTTSDTILPSTGTEFVSGR